jgi:hypothetical protein
MTDKMELHNFAARCDGYATTCSDPADAERWRRLAASYRELAERPTTSCGVSLPLRIDGNTYPGILLLGMMP